MSRPDLPDDVQAEMDRACACIDERRFADAIPHAEEVARRAPTWSAAWWNLSVVYKHAARWRDALDAVDRAIALGERDDGIHWNAAIAATALGDWARARVAWRAAGIDVPDGDGPIELDAGPAPIRIPHDDPGEVVWARRLDPCRARILSVPLPESGRRHGDVVLHDGEPRGQRRLGGRTVDVFHELALLEPSSFGTWVAVIRCAGPRDVEEVERLFEDTDVAVEDWTESVAPICQACSLGAPHEHPKRAWQPERRIGLAARDESELTPLGSLRTFWRKDLRSLLRVL